MTRWIELYTGTAANSQIAPGDSEFFAGDNIDQSNKRRYGSMNSLIITYTGTAVIEVNLDGAVFGRFSNTSMVIKPEDGRFFEIIKITNKDGAANVTAGDIQVRWARARAING